MRMKNSYVYKFPVVRVAFVAILSMIMPHFYKTLLEFLHCACFTLIQGFKRSRVKKTTQSLLFVVALTYIINAGLTWWFNGDPAALVRPSVSTAGFLMLLPIGLILVIASAVQGDSLDIPDSIGTAIIVWAVAVLAYFGAGFALQFGGLAVINQHPDFTELYWNWSPLDSSYGDYWGVVGLRGWALLGAAMTPGILDLFLRHIALVGVVVVIPTFLLYRRMTLLGLIVFGILVGGFVYPLVGNWVWSGGWLSQLGVTQRFGHGFVDAGIATPLAMGGIIALAASLIFREEPRSLHDPESQVVSDSRALFSFLGVGLVLWSWAFYAALEHIPSASAISVPLTTLNGLLSALTGGLMAAIYTRLTAAEGSVQTISKATIAGLVAVSTVAPFISPWQSLVVGVAVGLLTPVLIYSVDHLLPLNDVTGSVVVFAVFGVVAWLLPGLIADGHSGIGWNGIGQESYLAVVDQGVSGLWVASGYVSDWPGQFLAQVAGAIIISSWAFLLAFFYFRGYYWLFESANVQQSTEETDVSRIESPQAAQ